MEDLLTIVLVVIAIIVKVRNGMKNTAEEAVPSPAEQPTDWEGEHPPYVLVDEEELVEDTEKKSKIEQMMAMLGKSKDTQQAPMPKVAPKPVINKPATKPIVTRKAESHCEHNINRELHSTQGARRAFIYSEIFKKKYE
jgi:hypothetical protein